MLSKLTLSLDPTVVAQAKQYAQDSHTSLSRLVENYLRQLVSQSDNQVQAGPVLSQINGILKQAEIEDYRDYLAKKYQ
ncbi:MAG: hypothetical protein IV090_17215 [Candidatus Sericytochromatia bacterium]|nr:hypothetical protein [Candidatus Sericytochromatia bacterium]